MRMPIRVIVNRRRDRQHRLAARPVPNRQRRRRVQNQNAARRRKVSRPQPAVRQAVYHQRRIGLRIFVGQIHNLKPGLIRRLRQGHYPRRRREGFHHQNSAADPRDFRQQRYPADNPLAVPRRDRRVEPQARIAVQDRADQSIDRTRDDLIELPDQIGAGMPDCPDPRRPNALQPLHQRENLIARRRRIFRTRRRFAGNDQFHRDRRTTRGQPDRADLSQRSIRRRQRNVR